MSNKHGYEKGITIKQLKYLLAGLPDEMTVEVEGCDCYGAAGGVLVLTTETVLIVRKANLDDYEEVVTP